MLRILGKKADNTQKEINNISREIDSVGKNKKEMQ